MVGRITQSGGGPVSPSNVKLASFELRGFYYLGYGLWALGPAGLLLSKVTITKYAEPFSLSDLDLGPGCTSRSAKKDFSRLQLWSAAPGVRNHASRRNIAS